MTHREYLATVLVLAAVSSSCVNASDSIEEPADLVTTIAVPAPTSTQPLIPEVIISVVGDEELVFDYSEANCSGLARPDLSVRATRTGDELSLTLAHPTNHRMMAKQPSAL